MTEVTQDDADLNFYESVRKNMVTQIVKNGVPTDPEMGSLLLKAIDGGSRTILAKKRLEVDKESNETMAQQQAIMAEVLRSVPTAKQAKARTSPLPEVEMVEVKPGETTVGTKEVRYNQIMGKEEKTSP